MKLKMIRYQLILFLIDYNYASINQESFNFKMSFSQESIQLVGYNQREQFYLTSEAKHFLVSIQKPLAIITITGIYQTGKSYLVNKLIKNRHNGFKIGSNSQQTTKGLNIWGRPILAQDEKGNQIYYLVIDSEGIGSYQKQSKYDMKLLMLIFLISSTVIFNSMGAIDQMILEQLRVILNFKDSLKHQESNEKPKLVWILRDFSLQLVDRQGQQISSNQYLQNCLEYLKGSSIQIKRKNEIRKAIKQGFARRTCFTLVRPTFQQQNIYDLSKCRLRQQFLKQIEDIRETVFSGSTEDVKIINGSKINGPIFLKYLQQFISKLNHNQKIQLKQITMYITQQYNTEYFQKLNSQMKAQITKLSLPLPKEQLKQKLNQIQNQFYKRIENQFFQLQDFKKYHRQFLKATNKINKQINTQNNNLLKAKILKQIKEFIRENFDIHNIQPTNLIILKVLVQRIQLKIKGQVQGYQIVLENLFNIMEVCQSKVINLQKEVIQQRKFIELSNSQKKNYDLNSLSLKKELHQALKIINNLKLTQEQLQKQLLLAHNKLKMYETQIKQLQQSQNSRVNFLTKHIDENNGKFKNKIEEHNQLVKNLRQENNKLINEIQILKSEKLHENLNYMKEVIFQEKINEILTKKQNQKKTLQSQLNQLIKSLSQLQKKYEEEQRLRQIQAQSHKIQLQKLYDQQKIYLKQIKSIKALQNQNKKTYNETLNAIKDNDRAFKNIENISFSNSKLLTSCKKNNLYEQKEVTKKYEEIIQKLKLQFEEKQNYNNQKTNKIIELNDSLKKKCKQLETQFQKLKKEKYNLQNQLLQARQRFADTMSQIQINKEKQRSFYQQSIVRLLGNIERKQSANNSYFTQKR